MCRCDCHGVRRVGACYVRSIRLPGAIARLYVACNSKSAQCSQDNVECPTMRRRIQRSRRRRCDCRVEGRRQGLLRARGILKALCRRIRPREQPEKSGATKMKEHGFSTLPYIRMCIRTIYATRGELAPARRSLEVAPHNSKLEFGATVSGDGM
jgi:hypothetical protein